VHLALVGMMGSGKTTVGTRVAEALQWPFLDSDRMIEAREGRTVREIWLADGEPAYRDLETKVLEEALALPDPAVVAAAGGVVLRDENRRLLKRADVCTVRLVADPEVLVTRVGQQGHRPLLAVFRPTFRLAPWRAAAAHQSLLRFQMHRRRHGPLLGHSAACGKERASRPGVHWRTDRNSGCDENRRAGRAGESGG
jgi:shikimate kinase